MDGSEFLIPVLVLAFASFITGISAAVAVRAHMDRKRTERNSDGDFGESDR